MEPTKRNPRFFSSLLMASDLGVEAGHLAVVLVATSAHAEIEDRVHGAHHGGDVARLRTVLAQMKEALLG